MKLAHIEALERFVDAGFLIQGGGKPKLDRLLAAKVCYARTRAGCARAGKRLGERANPAVNRAMHGQASSKKTLLTHYHRISAIRGKQLP
jgi:hypothetical protein